MPITPLYEHAPRDPATLWRRGAGPFLPLAAALVALLVLARPAAVPTAQAQAAPATASHYVVSPWWRTDTVNTGYTLGRGSCAQSGYIFLAFGSPVQATNGALASKGLIDLTPLPVLATSPSSDSVEQRVEDFLTGYYSCPSPGLLTLAVGTDNRGTDANGTGTLPPNHGAT